MQGFSVPARLRSKAGLHRLQGPQACRRSCLHGAGRSNSPASQARCQGLVSWGLGGWGSESQGEWGTVSAKHSS